MILQCNGGKRQKCWQSGSPVSPIWWPCYLSSSSAPLLSPLLPLSSSSSSSSSSTLSFCGEKSKKWHIESGNLTFSCDLSLLSPILLVTHKRTHAHVRQERLQEKVQQVHWYDACPGLFGKSNPFALLYNIRISLNYARLDVRSHVTSIGFALV